MSKQLTAIFAAQDKMSEKFERMAKSGNKLVSSFSTVENKLGTLDKNARQAQERLTKLGAGTYRVNLTAQDKASMTLNLLNNKLRTFTGKSWRITLKAVDMVTKPVRTMLSGLNSALGMMGLGLGFTGGIVIPIKMAIEQENVETAFEVLLGSKEAAVKRVNDLTTFAGNTPYMRDEIYEASRILQVFTGNALSGGDGLTLIGDVASGTKQQLSDVATWFGRMYDGMKNNRPIGEATARLQEMGAIGGEARAKLEELAEAPMDIESKWAAAEKEFARFSGLMENLSDKTGNLLLGVKSFVTNNVLKRIGKGLSDGINPILKRFRQWRKDNADIIEKMGQDIERFVTIFTENTADRFSGMIGRISNIINSSDFQNADMFGKIKIAWDKIIAEPFSNWWNSSGRQWLSDKANDIGFGIGSAIKGGLLAILGITHASAVDDGISIGKSFAEGFISGFDPETLGKAIFDTIKSSGKDVFSGQGTTSDWLVMAMSAYGLFKGGKELKNVLFGKPQTNGGIVGGLKNIGNWIKGSKGGSGALSSGISQADDYVSWWQNAKLLTGVNSRSNVIADYQKTFRGSVQPSGLSKITKFTDYFKGFNKVTENTSKFSSTLSKAGTGIAKSAGKVAPVLSKVGRFAKGNALGLAFSGLSIAMAKDKKRETAKQTGVLAGSIAGAKLGAATAGAVGAAVGSVAPGIGNAIGGTAGVAIGGIVGGIGGAFGGDAFMDWLYGIKDPVFQWAQSAGESIGGFFTDTLPNFFTQTIPQTIKTIWSSISSFAGEIRDKFGGFFAKTLPNFIMETIPTVAGHIGRNINGFFSVEIPCTVNSGVSPVSI